MDEKNNKDMDQAIINIIKQDIGEEITIYYTDRKHYLAKYKLHNNVPQSIIVKFRR